MNIFNSHIKLFSTAAIFFISLSIIVAIIPALNNQEQNAPLPGTEPLSGDALKGKDIFIANGCVACHTQQVRNVEMDKPYGSRPSIAADYANNSRMSWWMNSATLMGTERTGPDLTNIGNRMPGAEWHLLHLYNPRAVVEASIMPSYEWMFELKEEADMNDKTVNVPAEFLKGKKGVVVAKEEALQLVAYLQSLRQEPLPNGTPSPKFLYNKKQDNPTKSIEVTAEAMLDGAQLYAANCQACHQSSGEGLKGAFPPLKGSKIVMNENPEMLIDIIMNGYNAREEYAEMPAIGKVNNLSDAEITAIINHERSSWGNQAEPVAASRVEEIITYLNQSKTISSAK